MTSSFNWKLNLGLFSIGGTEAKDEPAKSTKEETHENKWSLENLEKQLSALLEGTINTSKPQVSWNEVAGLYEAKAALQMAAEMPRKQPQLFQGKIKPSQSILLYGPPGTGKSHIVRALAASVDSTLFVVSVSDVKSKWAGESERLIKVLFEKARRKKPSIVFFDEVDALCGKRNEYHTASDTGMKNEMLIQMDGFDKNNSDVLFVAATNAPWSIDPAFIRRFERRIYIPMPDLRARRELLKFEMGFGEFGKNDLHHVEELAVDTEGLSGGDIKILVKEGFQRRLLRAMNAKYFYKDQNGWYLPCEDDEIVARGGVRMDWREVPDQKLGQLPYYWDDFKDSLEKIKPSVDPATVPKYEQWTKKHGSSGA